MEPETLEQLRSRLTAEYPGWHIWPTRPDENRHSTLMATRIEHITDDLVREGLCRTLPWSATDHPSTLEAQLAQQTELAKRIGHYPAKVLL